VGVASSWGLEWEVRFKAVSVSSEIYITTPPWRGGPDSSWLRRSHLLKKRGQAAWAADSMQNFKVGAGNATQSLLRDMAPKPGHWWHGSVTRRTSSCAGTFILIQSYFPCSEVTQGGLASLQEFLQGKMGLPLEAVAPTESWCSLDPLASSMAVQFQWGLHSWWCFRGTGSGVRELEVGEDSLPFLDGVPHPWPQRPFVTMTGGWMSALSKKDSRKCKTQKYKERRTKCPELLHRERSTV
jgi:hypothetical protein